MPAKYRRKFPWPWAKSQVKVFAAPQRRTAPANCLENEQYANRRIHQKCIMLAD